MQDKVSNHGEDTKYQLQDLALKVQLILERCDTMALSLQLPPPQLLEGLYSDVPIHMDGGLEQNMSNTSHTQDSHPNVAMQTNYNKASPWKPWEVVEEEALVDVMTYVQSSSHQAQST